MNATADYTFTVAGARTLVANFVALPPLAVVPGAPGTMILSWSAAATGWVLEETSDLVTWTPSPPVITSNAGPNTVIINTGAGSIFFRLALP